MTPTEQAADRLKASLARNPHMLKEEPGQDLLAVLSALTALQARVGELEGALKELASEDFAGPPGVSIYAAAANELPRRIKLAQAALLTPPLEQE